MNHRQFSLDLIYEVLAGLPTKSLVRFKSVSKPWNKMINDPYLAHKQLHGTRGLIKVSDKLCFLHDNRKAGTERFTARISEERIEMFIPSLEYSLECCCNGLYCFSPCYNNNVPTILFNPLRQETLELPSNCRPHQGWYAVHGLGFDAKNNIFKVIRFVCDHDYVCRRPELLVLGQKSWKQIEVAADWQCIPGAGTVFLCGAVHCSCYYKGVHGGEEHNIILAFDIEKEEFRLVKCPPISTRDFRLMELGGSLAIPDDNFYEGSIWVLKDYSKGEWAVACKINWCELAPSVSGSLEFLPVVVGACGNEVFSRDEFGDYVFHDMRTSQTRKLSWEDTAGARIHQVYGHQLSLLPLSQWSIQ